MYEKPELKEKVCLLDPAAKEELSPKDAEKFDVFLFGGILGTQLFELYPFEDTFL
jgi:ribosome biogenesis SPOUT family RNA methylase Rps3